MAFVPAVPTVPTREAADQFLVLIGKLLDDAVARNQRIDWLVKASDDRDVVQGGYQISLTIGKVPLPKPSEHACRKTDGKIV